MSSKDLCSRRQFMAASLAASALASSAVAFPSENASDETVPRGASALLSVDYRKLVARADLTYTTPVSRSEEGMPLGNGRMGSLVWTSPTALKFQFNRPDVFAENCTTNSFPARNTDYSAGCGYVDVDFADFGADVFAGEDFRQHLSAYDAVVTVQGKGVTARILAWHERDVFAIEIDDERSHPETVRINIRMLRHVVQYIAGQNYALAGEHAVKVETRDQSATSQLEIRGGRIALTQTFREGGYYNASAVAADVLGRPAKAKIANDSTVCLAVAPGNGKFTILISSASSFDPNQDVAALALTELAAALSFDALAAGNRTWWHDFWTKSFVHMRSADGDADYVEQNHTYFLYLMASCSRGSYPPRFGGLIWITNGDMREWGSQHWWANTSCYYEALPPLNHPELLDPLFSMYTGMYGACARAAQQQWGSHGIYIPETCWFDGLDDLPEDIAAEMRDLYLVRKPWDQRSARFREYAEPKQPYTSRWNWKDKGKWINGVWTWRDKGAGPYGQTSHMLCGGAKIAFLYWLRYEHSQDETWLRERAYPMLKGIAEFFRHYPNAKKGEDGKYHIHNVNNSEPVWGAQDTNEALSAMHGILPLAIRASTILGVDQGCRSLWQEFLENLAPVATNDSPGALQPRKPGGPRIWIGGLPPVRKGDLSRPGLIPAYYYDLCTVETEDAEMVKTGSATYDASIDHPLTQETPVWTLSWIGAAAAHLGRAEDIKLLIPNQIRCLTPRRHFPHLPGSGPTCVLRNRLSLREGPGNIEFERIGRASRALHLTLLQSVPPAPGKDPILNVFPAWPKEWDAQFTLLARGAFLVTSAARTGEVEFVELLSQAGGECRLRNPWGKTGVVFYRNGVKAEEKRGSLVIFPTSKGENIVVVRDGTTPGQYKRRV